MNQKRQEPPVQPTHNEPRNDAQKGGAAVVAQPHAARWYMQTLHDRLAGKSLPSETFCKQRESELAREGLGSAAVDRAAKTRDQT